MKKLCIILSLVLLFSAFGPSAAAETGINSADSAQGYIVKLKSSAGNTAVLMENTNIQEVYEGAELYHADSLSDIAKLGDRVEYYEPDCTVTLDALPNDPYISKQWSIDFLGATAAWDKGYNGKGIKIGVIDSGVNISHEDFAGTSFEQGYNVITGTNDVTDEMEHGGHGTFVCGILAAASNNGLGIAGFCPKVTIVPIKCFGKGSESSASYIISAVYEAVDVYDCDVINMSLGTEMDLESLRTAIEYAAGKGAIIVSAVGNKGTSQLNYPAAYTCVIGVGSVDSKGSVASFSEKNQSVFVVAPGVDIVSLQNTANNAYKVDGAGTSFSTPFVSAAAVILKQYAPSATVTDFGNILKASVIDGGADGYDTSYGYGTLNIANFVTAMEKYEFANIGSIFSDVEGHWAKDSIEYCVDRKLFKGITDSSFEPETLMNRAMFVTVLSRLSGETISGYQNDFFDVPSGQWYAQPCSWGAATGIVSGTGGGNFSPLTAVTREQMAVLLYRYAMYYGLADGSFEGTPLLAYADAGSVSSWAKSAVAWAVSNGLITGRSGGTLAPQDSAKRCEVATIISRFALKFNA